MRAAILVLLCCSLPAQALEPQAATDARVRCWIRVHDAATGQVLPAAEIGVRYAGRGGIPPPPLGSGVLECDAAGLVLYDAEALGMPYGMVRAPGYAARYVWPRPGH